MPFVELGINNDWISFSHHILTVSAPLRKNFKLLSKGRYRIFYDGENKLFAVQEDHTGFKMGRDGRISTRTIAELFLSGRYVASWDGEKVIADLNQKIEE